MIERKGKSEDRIVPVEDTNSQDTPSSLSPEQQELLEDFHSLPTVSMDKDPTTVLRNLRKRKRVQAK